MWIHTRSERRGCRALPALLLAAALLVPAAMALAETGRTPGVAGPDPAPAVAVARPAAASVAAVPTLPRTRADARARIDAIDPARWLARFGPVERRETDAPRP